MVDIAKASQPVDAPTQRAAQEAELRAAALKRLKKRRDLAAHALVYVLVNGFLIVIWAITSHGFFWPVFPLAGWGIGLAMNAWDVWRGDEFTEDDVAREIARMNRDGHR